MKRFLFSLLLFLLWVTATKAQTYDELVDKSLAAIEADSLMQAENYIREAVRLEPADVRNALLFSNLGTLQRTRHRYEQALESYNYALNFAPKAVPILLNRATLYMEMNRPEQARVDYSLVLDLDKENHEALLMRAYILMKQRNYKESQADYERLLQLQPKSYNGRLGLVTLHQHQGNYNDALAIVGGMIVEGAELQAWGNRNQAMLYVARAGIENEQQHTELALMDLEEAIKIDPNLSDIYLLRGQIYLSLRRGSLAKDDFETCVRLGIPMADMRELIRQCK